MLTEITSITTVASQPNARSHPLTAANLAMMSRRHAIFIMTVIIATATTRFSIAGQQSALIGE